MSIKIDLRFCSHLHSSTAILEEKNLEPIAMQSEHSLLSLLSPRKHESCGRLPQSTVMLRKFHCAAGSHRMQSKTKKMTHFAVFASQIRLNQTWFTTWFNPFNRITFLLCAEFQAHGSGRWNLPLARHHPTSDSLEANIHCSSQFCIWIWKSFKKLAI